ncbi:hypothetical protein G4228_014589, partial [Cervus hanglu yarkandensis]
DSQHHGIFLKVGCAMIIILLVIVIVLSMLVSFDSSTVRTSCPTKDWRPHGGKCYWVAENENKKSWNESKNDCVMKNAHLMVIRDFTDTTFLGQNIHDSFWVGLRIPPGGELWTWLDNSTFDPQLFKTIGIGECAYLHKIGISSASTHLVRKWICSKPDTCTSKS